MVHADRHNEANSRFSRFYERGKKIQWVYQFAQMESRNVRRTTVTRIMTTAPRTSTFNTHDVSGLGRMTVPRWPVAITLQPSPLSCVCVCVCVCSAFTH